MFLEYAFSKHLTLLINFEREKIFQSRIIIYKYAKRYIIYNIPTCHHFDDFVLYE